MSSYNRMDMNSTVKKYLLHAVSYHFSVHVSNKLVFEVYDAMMNKELIILNEVHTKSSRYTQN